MSLFSLYLNREVRVTHEADVLRSTHQSLGQPAWQLFKPAPLSQRPTVTHKDFGHVNENILNTLFAYKFTNCFSFSSEVASEQLRYLKASDFQRHFGSFSLARLRQLGR